MDFDNVIRLNYFHLLYLLFLINVYYVQGINGNIYTGCLKSRAPFFVNITEKNIQRMMGDMFR